MNLLGISQSHGSAACLFYGGAVVGMAQEERLTKRKSQVGFPRRMIAELLDDHLDIARGSPGQGHRI